MMLKGIVSTVDNVRKTAKAIIPEKDNTITFNIPYASHISMLNVNDLVAIAVFNNSLSDALIIAKFPVIGGE